MGDGPRDASPPDWGVDVTVDDHGNYRGSRAHTPAGSLEHEPSRHDAPGDDRNAQRLRQANERIGAALAALDQAMGLLTSAQDAANIAHATVSVLTMANNLVHDQNWVEGEGLADETRAWTGVTGHEGAADAFEEARRTVLDAVTHVRTFGEHLLQARDVDNQWVERGARGSQLLTHLAQSARYARTRLGPVTPATLALLSEALVNLNAATDGDTIVRDVVSVLTMANNLVHGAEQWEPDLADETRAWTAVAGGSPHLIDAKTAVHQAGEQLHRDATPWQHHPMDAAARTQLLHPLTSAAQQARSAL